MWTINIRYGLAELVTLAGLLLVAGLLTLAFLNEWTIALVPGMTYALATGTTYYVYRRYAGAGARAAEPAAAKATFRVVDTWGTCPMGRQKGDLVRLGAAGSVSPQLCEAAQTVLRLAASGEEPEVEKWCCPIFEHQLIFQRELKAA